jgi:YcxB-like protein
MRVTYKLSEDDLIEAQGRHGGLRTKAIFVFGLLLILAGLGSIALNPKQNAGAILPILIGLFFLFGSRVSIRRSFRQDNRLQQPFEAVVSQDGIDISSPTVSSKYAWSSFTRYVESKNLFLVYQAPKVFNVFPKRAFAPGEEESFRSLLSERVGTTSVAHRMRISPQAWILLAVVTMAGILLVMAIRNVR